jgi:hypothetical protein
LTELWPNVYCINKIIIVRYQKERSLCKFPVIHQTTGKID